MSISVYLLCTNNHNMLLLCSYAADPPRITTHPRGVKDAVPGNHVTFAIEATGTEPLNYQWECKIEGSGAWQSCDVERFPGTNGAMLIFPSVQKSNEGNYRCTVSNCAGSETSECATLAVGELNCCVV